MGGYWVCITFSYKYIITNHNGTSTGNINKNKLIYLEEEEKKAFHLSAILDFHLFHSPLLVQRNEFDY